MIFGVIQCVLVDIGIKIIHRFLKIENAGNWNHVALGCEQCFTELELHRFHDTGFLKTCKNGFGFQGVIYQIITYYCKSMLLLTYYYQITTKFTSYDVDTVSDPWAMAESNTSFLLSVRNYFSMCACSDATVSSVHHALVFCLHYKNGWRVRNSVDRKVIENAKILKMTTIRPFFENKIWKNRWKFRLFLKQLQILCVNER